jgi:PAT family beta-lactamase induction signal transducer AmpG
MWMVLLHTVFNSMQDVAVDALAVDLLEEHERGRANGLMYASKYGGGMIGGAGMSTVIALSGLRSALVLQVIVLGAIMLVPLLVRERAGPPEIRPKLGAVLRSLARAFTLRSTILCGVLMLGVNVATGMLNAIANVLFTQRLGWTDTEYAQLTGGPGLAMGLGGSVLGGFLADKVGHRRLAAIASAMLGISWLMFGLVEPWWTNRSFIYGLALVEPLCQSVMTVSLFALCMDVAWPRVAATQFTVYMALANFSMTQGFKLAGSAEQWWEYSAIFLVAGGMQLAVTLVLPWIDPNQTRRTLAADPARPG